jgi:signal transduction histidine kinase
METASLWASAHSASPREFHSYLERSFPDLTLDERGRPRVRPEARRELQQETGSAVRMFLYEGTFFAAVLIAGIFFMYWTLRREVTFERRQSSFLSAISHELKTPITALRLYSETLERPRLKEQQRTEVLGSMRENLDRLTSLIDRLLQARAMLQSSPEIRRQTLHLAEETAEAVRQSGETLQDVYPAEFELDLDSALRVRVDPEHWRIIVSNLLENAAKYSPAGERVTVRLKRRGRRAVLSVIDHGAGFTRSQRRRLFQRFYRAESEDTRRRPGSGIGLYLVRQLAGLHGGRVQASSAGPGKGAVFSVSLPLA